MAGQTITPLRKRTCQHYLSENVLKIMIKCYQKLHWMQKYKWRVWKEIPSHEHYFVCMLMLSSATNFYHKCISWRISWRYEQLTPVLFVPIFLTLSNILFLEGEGKKSKKCWVNPVTCIPQLLKPSRVDPAELFKKPLIFCPFDFLINIVFFFFVPVTEATKYLPEKPFSLSTFWQ